MLQSTRRAQARAWAWTWELVLAAPPLWGCWSLLTDIIAMQLEIAAKYKSGTLASSLIHSTVRKAVYRPGRRALTADSPTLSRA